MLMRRGRRQRKTQHTRLKVRRAGRVFPMVGRDLSGRGRRRAWRHRKQGVQNAKTGYLRVVTLPCLSTILCVRVFPRLKLLHNGFLNVQHSLESDRSARRKV